MTPETFKKTRKALGYKTQLSLAKKLKISVRSVSGYETGEQPIPEIVSLAVKGLQATEGKST